MRDKWKMILGLNARNRRFVYKSNDRRTIRIANDKLLTRTQMEQNGIPMPELLGCVITLAEIKSAIHQISNGKHGAVIKPNWGAGGARDFVPEIRW